MEAEKQELPPWIVLDVRQARGGVQSGISRFIVGVSRALADEIRHRRTHGALPPDMKLMFASKYEPSEWIVDLVRQYPDVTSFWSGGDSALSSRHDKPSHWWSTGAVKKLKRYIRSDFVWIAPGNCDRPNSVARLFGKKNFARVVQVIHDVIPFDYPKSMGFFAGLRYRMRVKATLGRFPLVATVSEQSAESLKRLSKSANTDLRVLGQGVDDIFGLRHRPSDASERNFLRREFLASAGFVSAGPFEQELLSCRWILGVGASQEYKNWGVVEKVVSTPGHLARAVFVHIDGSAEVAKDFAARGAERVGACWFLKEKNVLLMPAVSDEVLSLAYCVSDFLVHPSSAEGFGLPPVEAALSGLPVLFRKGTVVESHFAEGRLPEFFWHGVEGGTETVWAQAMFEMLNANAKREKFFSAMMEAKSPRDFVLKSAGLEGAFAWRTVAARLLDALQAHHNFKPSGEAL